MSTIASKNSICVGEVDWYCLACSKHLVTEDEVVEHILHPEHAENMKTCGYLEQFKDDRIKKIKGVYFCEFCNVTFKTVINVGRHIEEKTHLDVKTEGRWNRVRGNIVFQQHNTSIKENVWNGVVDGTCVLCNVELDHGDVAGHKAGQTHILNVISCKVTVEARGAYRKISDVIQCLTCNVVISESAFKEHLNSKYHNNRFTDKDVNIDATINMIEESNTKLLTNELTKSKNNAFTLSVEDVHVQSQQQDLLTQACTNETKRSNDVTDTDTKSHVLDYVSAHYKTDINIDLIKDIVVCKKCSKHISFDIEAIERHMVEHNSETSEKNKHLMTSEKPSNVDGKTLYTKPMSMKNKEAVASSKSVFKHVVNLAKEHGLFFDKDENNIYCKICNSQVTATVQNINEHVAGSKHKKNLSKYSIIKKQQTNKYQKVSMKDFVTEIELVKVNDIVNLTSDIFFIFNDSNIANVKSFHCLALFRNKLICRVCNIDVPEPHYFHLLTQVHVDLLENSYVITSLKEEFVRQLKTDLFDCVYCGHVEEDWDDMLTHLSTSEHKKRKDSHKKVLAHCKQDRQIERDIAEHIFRNNILTDCKIMRL